MREVGSPAMLFGGERVKVSREVLKELGVSLKHAEHPRITSPSPSSPPVEGGEATVWNVMPKGKAGH
jgi:hypothetical protein